MQEELKEDSQKRPLEYVFGGLSSHQLVGQNECNHVKEGIERFFNLQLDIKNKRHIQESLDAQIAGDLLSGDNEYFCEKCNARVDTLKRVCVRTLPRNLIMHLKRFDFDLDLCRRVKLNNYLEFPEYLDMEAYTKKGLAQKENREYDESEIDMDEKQKKETKEWNDIYDVKSVHSIYRLSDIWC